VVESVFAGVERGHDVGEPISELRGVHTEAWKHVFFGQASERPPPQRVLQYPAVELIHGWCSPLRCRDLVNALVACRQSHQNCAMP